MFKTILIANRGEIACRIIHTARRLGINVVSVYSDIDASSKHVQMSNQAYYLGGNKSSESYLNIDKIIDIALKSESQAIHPGYGFLSENSLFVQKCNQANIKFIGPPFEAIQAMGSKIESKKIMNNANVPVVPGYYGDNQDRDFLVETARSIRYPILIKADLGGGGKGMRIVKHENEFLEALNSCQNEASKSFSSAKVLLEKYIENSKHIEVQVFGDHHGNYVHFFERDCTIQRRHQKVIEEAPSFLDDQKRNELCNAAIQAARAVGYTNAGTVEFIYDVDEKQFYFMEMNTRLQVEHPVSEMITRKDFVELQLRIAAGEELPFRQQDIKKYGHAIECRIYSENPEAGFLPGSGKITFLKEPRNSQSENPDHDVRVDTGIRENDQVSIFYDPMISKLICHGENRELAIRKTLDALENYKVYGLPTNIKFLQRILKNPIYQNWDFDTNFIAKNHSSLFPDTPKDHYQPLDVLQTILCKVLLSRTNFKPNSFISNPWDVLDGFRINHNKVKEYNMIISDDKNIKCRLVNLSENRFNLFIDDKLVFDNVSAQLVDRSTLRVELKDLIVNTMFLKKNDDIVLLKSDGDQTVIKFSKVDYGNKDDSDNLSSNTIIAPMPATVSKVFVKEGDLVKKGQSLISVDAMKMEHTLKANKDAKIKSLLCQVDSFVNAGELLIVFE